MSMNKLPPHIDSFLKDMQKGLMQRLRTYFLTGLVVTAPIGITIYLTYIFLSFIDKQFSQIFPGLHAIPGSGIILALSFFIFFGWLARNFLGKILLNVTESIVGRVPVIRLIYGALKQLLQTLMASKSSAFREVVMLEYPNKGMWSVGFVTGSSTGDMQRVAGAELVNVFIPLGLNPTAGFMVFIERQHLHSVDLTMEEAMKLVISGGIITPPARDLADQIADTAPETIKP